MEGLIEKRMLPSPSSPFTIFPLADVATLGARDELFWLCSFGDVTLMLER